MSTAKTKAKPAPARQRPQVPPVPANVNALMSRPQVCMALGGIGKSKLAAMIKTGEFPKPDDAVGTYPRWTVECFNAWVASRRHGEI